MFCKSGNEMLQLLFIFYMWPVSFNVCLVVRLLTRAVGIHSLTSWWRGKIWDSVLSLLLKTVFQLRRQVEGATSHWGQRRGRLMNFKIIGSFKVLFYRVPTLFDKGRGRNRSQTLWREPILLPEPDKGCGQFLWHFLDGYELFERCKYSLLESCIQRGLN